MNALTRGCASSASPGLSILGSRVPKKRDTFETHFGKANAPGVRPEAFLEVPSEP